MVKKKKMETKYKVYIIKCIKTEQAYAGRTDSVNPKYNPISVLYNRYKKDNTKYVALGDCIKEHKFSNFAFTIIKENLTEEESDALLKKIKEHYADKSLNDEIKKVDYFSAEMEKFKSW